MVWYLHRQLSHDANSIVIGALNTSTSGKLFAETTFSGSFGEKRLHGNFKGINYLFREQEQRICFVLEFRFILHKYTKMC